MGGTKKKGLDASRALARRQAASRKAEQAAARGERISDAQRKRAVRARERDLAIPPPAEPNRRADCLADVFLFLPTYFPWHFYQPFTSVRRTMIEAIVSAARYAGDQAIAGPRCDGKTRSTMGCALALMLAGHISFPLIISKSGKTARRELKTLKHDIATSDTLAADFPELVLPIREVHRWASRARQQTVFGRLTFVEWADEHCIFPQVDSALLHAHGWPESIESAAAGQVIASLGIEGPIRGFNLRGGRPDLVLLDDVDNRESAKSEEQTDDREHIIEEDIGGLGGPDRTVSRVFLGTLINRTCCAATFTDPKQKPSFRGQRHKLLEELPERWDLAEQYIDLWRAAGEDDPCRRAAHRFYIENRAKIEAGARLSNPHRFDDRPQEDGEPKEVSALQFALNAIAKYGLVHFQTEYQNEPPEELGFVDSGISARAIQLRLSGYERGVVPPDATLLTHGIDVKKVGAHWLVRAWRPDATCWIVDYGFTESHGTRYGSDQGVERAVKNVILDRMDQAAAGNYCRPDGEVVPIDLTLVDSGWQTAAVYAACAQVGAALLPAKGYGKSQGCAAAAFHPVTRRSKTRRPGDGWFLSRQPGGVWLVNCDTDRWKSFEHARWLTEPSRPGAAWLFGSATAAEEKYLARRLPAASREHHSLAHHLTAETEGEDLVRGVLVRKWKPRAGRAHNHYFDAAYLSCVAAAMKGLSPLGAAAPRPADQPRPSLAELARRAA